MNIILTSDPMDFPLNVTESILKNSFTWESLRVRGIEILFKDLNKRLCLSSTRGNSQVNNIDYSDSELISLLDVNENFGFEVIYRKYVGELFRYARKNVSSKEDCEEIIQDIFLDIWKRRNSLQHIVSIKGYLLKCVRFKVSPR